MQTATTTSTRPTFGLTHAALTLTALLWSSNFVIGRAIHEAVTPATMNFLRWAIALMVLIPVTLVDLRRHRAVLLRHWRLVALLGLTGIAAFQTLCYLALQQTTALNTILLISIAPLTIVGLSWMMLGERISRVQGLGLATSLGGTAVLLLHGDPEVLVSLQFNTGDLWMLLAVALWTIYSVLLKRRPAEVPPLTLHVASVTAGTVWMLPLFAWETMRGSSLPTAPEAWAAIAFVAVFSSAIAHALWVRGVASIGPNRASVFIHLMPLFGAVLAITFLGEELANYHAFGAALVLCGVALASRK